MSEFVTYRIEDRPPVPLILEPPLPVESPLHTASYTKGFQDGLAASGASNASLLLSGCGLLALILACVLLMSHASRLMGMFTHRWNQTEQSTDSKRLFSVLLPVVLCVVVVGCAPRKDVQESLPPVPMPPLSNVAAAPEKPVVPVHEEGQTLTVSLPPDVSQGASQGPRRGEPGELAALLEMQGTSDKKTAVNLMRPSAIREAAQLVTFQTAIAWRYRQLVTATEAYSSIMDTAFNFGPLLMTQGDALILPPVLTRAGASLRIESGETATAAQSSFELLSPARYVSVAPNWREFLMVDAFPEPEKPNPAVMPKNDKERRIWRAAVREAWAQGLEEADQLFADNVARMARTYRGVMLYHLLTAQQLLSKVNTASAEVGMKTSDNGNKLHIGQKVYRITAPSAFLPVVSSRDGQKTNKRK